MFLIRPRTLAPHCHLVYIPFCSCVSRTPQNLVFVFFPHRASPQSSFRHPSKTTRGATSLNKSQNDDLNLHHSLGDIENHAKTMMAIALTGYLGSTAATTKIIDKACRPTTKHPAVQMMLCATPWICISSRKGTAKAVRGPLINIAMHYHTDQSHSVIFALHPVSQ